MNLLNVCNTIDINSYFSFFLWFQILCISSFRLLSVAPENIDVRILSLNCFKLKTLKEVQLKCEMCDLGTQILINMDLLAFRF